MKDNKLIIQINKPVYEAFLFTITPPNSTRWIPFIIKEEISEWPVRIGTIYKLQNNKGQSSEVIVNDLKENEIVEWISKDRNYHCRYSFKTLTQNMTELEYHEWVNTGELISPFTLEILQKLKSVLEKT